MSSNLQQFEYRVTCTVEARSPEGGRAAVQKLLAQLTSSQLRVYFPELQAAVTMLTLSHDPPICIGDAVTYGAIELPSKN